jgi:hypothetical protein
VILDGNSQLRINPAFNHKDPATGDFGADAVYYGILHERLAHAWHAWTPIGWLEKSVADVDIISGENLAHFAPRSFY